MRTLLRSVRNTGTGLCAFASRSAEPAHEPVVCRRSDGVHVPAALRRRQRSERHPTDGTGGRARAGNWDALHAVIARFDTQFYPKCSRRDLPGPDDVGSRQPDRARNIAMSVGLGGLRERRVGTRPALTVDERQ